MSTSATASAWARMSSAFGCAGAPRSAASTGLANTAPPPAPAQLAYGRPVVAGLGERVQGALQQRRQVDLLAGARAPTPPGGRPGLGHVAPPVARIVETAYLENSRLDNYTSGPKGR